MLFEITQSGKYETAKGIAGNDWSVLRRISFTGWERVVDIRRDGDYGWITFKGGLIDLPSAACDDLIQMLGLLDALFGSGFADGP